MSGQITDRYARQILDAARALIGPEAYRDALRKAGLTRYEEASPPFSPEPGITFEEISAFCQAIRERFGPDGGWMLRRIDREVLQRDLQAYSWVANLVRLVSGILRAPRERVYNAWQRAAAVVRMETGSSPQVWREGGRVYWENPSCPYCVGVSCAEPCCDLPAGMLEALTAWVLERPVEAIRMMEESCRGRGEPACRYRVEW
jgi:hypothetical protein